MDRKTALILALSILFTFGCGMPARAAGDGTLTLNIAVTNPSVDEAQEVEIYTDLPEELRKTDIISADGLELKYDSAKGTCFVAGKVNLQPSETTFYNIKVRDVWTVPAEEIRRIQNDISKYPEINTADTAKKLAGMASRGREPAGTADAHIALFRKEKRELDEIKKELRAVSGSKQADEKSRSVILAAALVAIAAIAAFVIMSNKGALAAIKARIRQALSRDRRRFVRVPNSIEASCRLLEENTEQPFMPSSNVSNGGIAIFLEKEYKRNSPVELKLRIPDNGKSLAFKGFVVWQEKAAGPDKKGKYLTGISFAEVAREDNEILKDYIASHIK